MRKVLLFMASAALLVSCNTGLIDSEVAVTASESSPKGLVFEVASDDTRGIINQDYTSNFFAEQDRINIWFDNAYKATMYDIINASPAPTVLNWNTSNFVTYKVTKSTGDPLFSAIEDGQTLNFKEYNGNTSDKGHFFAAYPTGQTMYSIDPLNNIFTIDPNIDLSVQRMGDEMNFDNRLVYSYADGRREKSTGIEAQYGVGEKVKFKLTSPLSTLFIKFYDINHEIDSLFGALKDITVTSESNALVPSFKTSAPTVFEFQDFMPGQSGRRDFRFMKKSTPPFDKYNESDSGAPGFLYDNSTMSANDKVVYSANDNNNPFSWNCDANSKAVNRAKLVFNDGGIHPKQGQSVALFVLPTTNHTSTPESYSVVYKFANTTVLSQIDDVTLDFKANSSLEFLFKFGKVKYAVIDDGAVKKLYVSEGGKLSDIIDGSGNVTWYDDISAPTGIYTAGEFGEVFISSRAANLDATDFQRLDKCVNVKVLKIFNQTAKLEKINHLSVLEEFTAPYITEVVGDAFYASSSLNSTLKKLDLRRASTIHPQNYSFTGLTDLNLNAYNFPTPPDNDYAKQEVFFGSTSSSLINVHLAAVTDMAPVMGYMRTIKFAGFTSLQTVELNSSCTKVVGSAFEDCGSLKEVNGILDLTEAEKAFKNCNNVDLTTVNVFGSEIPYGCFQNSKVKNILVSGAQIVPTAIGAYAFENNDKVEVMDLGSARTIGMNAFYNASAFIGNNNASTRNIVTLVAQVIPQNAFNGTIIQRVILKNATIVGKYAFDVHEIKQIQFDKQNLRRNDINDEFVAIDCDRAYIDIFVPTQDDRHIFIFSDVNNSVLRTPAFNVVTTGQMPQN